MGPTIASSLVIFSLTRHHNLPVYRVLLYVKQLVKCQLCN